MMAFEGDQKQKRLWWFVVLFGGGSAAFRWRSVFKVFQVHERKELGWVHWVHCWLKLGCNQGQVKPMLGLKGGNVLER